MSISFFFSAEGPLAEALPHFEERPGQQALAQLIAQAIEESQICCVEAGTGLGKTLAYLLPAVLSGRRVLISTATKVLQEQLIQKDIPLLRRLLHKPIHAALLKGRQNYVCLHALEHYPAGYLTDPVEYQSYQRIVAWSRETKTGDQIEWPSMPHRTHWATQLSARRETCTGSQCPAFSRCFLFQSRREAAKADIVIVNHHFFAHEYIRHEDTVLQREVIIFDEAHHLPMVLRQCLGHRVSLNIVRYMCTQMQQRLREVLADVLQLTEAIMRVMTHVESWRSLEAMSGLSCAWTASDVPSEHRACCLALRESVELLLSITAQQRERHAELSAWHRSWSLVQTALAAFLTDDQFIHRLLVQPQQVQLLSIPLSIDRYLPELVSTSDAAWIFVSATLAIDHSVHFFVRQLGLDPEEVQSACLPSPFLYAEQGQLFVPLDCPEPHAPDYLETVLHQAVALITAAEGGALFLCSSWRHLHWLTRELESALPSSYTVLSADSLSLPAAIAAFQSMDQAVLIGAQSLWEGIDMPGQGLRLVIIDKIPFASPDDPVVEAEKQKDPSGVFHHYQLPSAIVSLKQGVGRLIRSPCDQGLIAIFDRRLLSKRYGERVLEQLPDFPRCHLLSEAVDYLNRQVPRVNPVM